MPHSKREAALRDTESGIEEDEEALDAVATREDEDEGREEDEEAVCHFRLHRRPLSRRLLSPHRTSPPVTSLLPLMSRTEMTPRPEQMPPTKLLSPLHDKLFERASRNERVRVF